MAPVASQLIREVTAHVQSDSLEDAREICADGTYFPNKLRIYVCAHLVQRREVLGGAVGCGTALQAGRSQVPFPKDHWEFSLT